MTVLKSRFNRKPKAWALSTILVLLGLFFGNQVLCGESKKVEEDRRNARVRATYVTRLIQFIRWDTNSTQQSESFKIAVLGNENVGFVQSLKFLASQSNTNSNGHPVTVAHFLNSQREDALRYIKSGVHFIYFTQDSDLTVSELKPIRNGAMFLAEGRSFVVDGSGCIGFEKTRNRIKLIVNEHCFRRRFAKVDPVLTSLRSVVEVVKKDI